MRQFHRRGRHRGPHRLGRAWTAAGSTLLTLLALATSPASAAAGAGPRGPLQPVHAVRPSPDASLSVRVFATREGLVGGVTANGHVIRERDHFVALPSRLGLSVRGGGERSVRVCAPNGRCAYAPVWDVGPWNTTDDYWNPRRQSWTDLPQGLPQAQAAYAGGYHGGRDEFGRAVANPAGIDLGDGTFWDALRLADNSWVTVSFLWTGAPGPRGRVTTGGLPLHLRAGPGTAAASTGLAGEHAQLPIQCQVRGQRIVGAVRTTDLWNRVAPGTFVSHAYVSVPAGFTVPSCR
ncbi:MAG TPA: hypothetical protein VNV66_14940 [Pilimelia sp.]|nr:hypothetical protein [Pilimelia sp.]